MASCLFPLIYNPVLKRLDARYGIPVACGKCYNCLVNRSRQWGLRCHHELSFASYPTFATFTYSDANLPRGGCLKWSDMQLFHKRLRKRVGSFKFFACGEYGPKTGRAHYHTLYFFTQPPNELSEPWGLGHVVQRPVSPVKDSACAYVANYCLKKWQVEEQFGFSVSPFLRLSQGIGARTFRSSASSILKRGYLYDGTYKAPIPRYYLKLAQNEFPELYREFMETHMDLTLKTAQSYDDFKQAELTQIAKVRLANMKMENFNERYR